MKEWRFGWFIPIILSIIFIVGIVCIDKLTPISYPYVVLIRAMDGNNVKWSGSGCFIKKDLILTAGHIVRDTKRFEIVLPNGHIRPGYFEYREDPNLTDVGFIRCHGKYPVGQLGANPYQGQDVWIAGYALAEMPLTLTKGIVSCINRYSLLGIKINPFQIDCAAWSGHSGAPILNNHNHIIGICIGIKMGQECWTLCIPVDVIQLSFNKYIATKALQNRGK